MSKEHEKSVPSEPIVESYATLKRTGPPRVAFFPPIALSAHALHLINRALMEDLADSLTRHRTFVVISPHSSFAVVDSQSTEQFSALNSDYFISGRMIPGVDRLALRLMHSTSQEIVWAAEYSTSLDDLPAAFRLICRQITKTFIQEPERKKFDFLRTDPKPLAYRHYLEGRNLSKASDVPKLRRARAEFQRAVEIDPGFAAPHAAIARSLQLEWLLQGRADLGLLVHARYEAARAVTIDPYDGTGHWMIGTIALYQRDFDYAGEKLRQAEALNPHSADLVINHADALCYLGNADAAWSKFKRALELNPFPPVHYWAIGASIALRLHDFEGAIELCKKISDDQSVLKILAVCYSHIQDFSAAKKYGEKLRELYPGLKALDIASIDPNRMEGDLNLVTTGLRLAGLD